MNFDPKVKIARIPRRAKVNITVILQEDRNDTLFYAFDLFLIRLKYL
jgi:hypothetical protein